MKKISLIPVLVAVLLVPSSVFSAGDIESIDEPMGIIADSLILRPLGIVSIAAGSAVFIVSLPVAVITKSTGNAFEVMVKQPYEYTLVRPLGDLEEGYTEEDDNKEDPGY